MDWLIRPSVYKWIDTAEYGSANFSFVDPHVAGSEEEDDEDVEPEEEEFEEVSAEDQSQSNQ
jgi:hypothetical protein